MIYTNIDGLILNEKTDSYICLGDKFADWIERNTMRMYLNSTQCEGIACGLLKSMNVDYETQCFFYESNTKQCYFLDFLLPDYNIAIEIDGGYHQISSQKKSDTIRDEFFKRIGISTIRYTNEQMSLPDIKSIIAADCKRIINKELDVYTYYNNVDKCNHKTLNQQMLDGISELIRKIPLNSRLLIRSDATYIQQVLNNCDYESKAEKWLNYEQIKYIYEYLIQSKIIWKVVYNGKNKKLCRNSNNRYNNTKYDFIINIRSSECRLKKQKH